MPSRLDGSPAPGLWASPVRARLPAFLQGLVNTILTIRSLRSFRWTLANPQASLCAHSELDRPSVRHPPQPVRRRDIGWSEPHECRGAETDGDQYPQANQGNQNSPRDDRSARGHRSGMTRTPPPTHASRDHLLLAPPAWFVRALQVESGWSIRPWRTSGAKP